MENKEEIRKRIALGRKIVVVLMALVMVFSVSFFSACRAASCDCEYPPKCECVCECECDCEVIDLDIERRLANLEGQVSQFERFASNLTNSEILFEEARLLAELIELKADIVENEEAIDKINKLIERIDAIFEKYVVSQDPRNGRLGRAQDAELERVEGETGRRLVITFSPPANAERFAGFRIRGAIGGNLISDGRGFYFLGTVGGTLEEIENDRAQIAQYTSFQLFKPGRVTILFRLTAPGFHPSTNVFVLAVDTPCLVVCSDFERYATSTWRNYIIVGEAGKPVDFSMAFAVTPTGSEVEISYELDEFWCTWPPIDGECCNTFTGLSQGLSLSTDGRITGIPIAAARPIIWVTARAEGYFSTRRSFRIKIEEPRTVVKDGVFEAEFVNVDELSGSGHGSSESGVGMILANDNASNGALVGFWTMHEFRFEFYSSRAVENAELSVFLASDAGVFRLSPNNYLVKVNGIQVMFPEFELRGANVWPYLEPVQQTSLGNIALKEGENIITIQTTVLGSSSHPLATPMLDAIRIDTTDAELSWRPRTFNLRESYRYFATKIG